MSVVAIMEYKVAMGSGCYSPFSSIQLATIIDQDRARAEAVVQLNLSKEVMNVGFDDICEYLVKEDEDDYIG